jgi:carbonic anhydrase
MSIFASSNTWAEQYTACGAPRQSPVNLSQSFAKPCDRLCELQIDKVAVPQATATIKSNLGMHLAFGDVKPTAKFNGEGYTCKEAYLFHPAQHTVEDVRAEAEFIALFENPKGFILAVSVPVRTAPGDTPSSSFFNRFVPYPSIADEPTQVTLGQDWLLQDIVPEGKGFFVYEGTWVTPPCSAEVTWCVFSQSVTIDPSDYAKLASRATGGNRPLQELAGRDVYYNDGEKVDSTFGKKDGKVYMRCRRVKPEGELPAPDTLKKSDAMLKTNEAAQKAQEVAVSNLKSGIGDLWNQMGGFWGLLMMIAYLALAYFFFFSTSGKEFVKNVFDTVLMGIANALHNLNLWIWFKILSFLSYFIPGFILAPFWKIYVFFGGVLPN